MKQFFFNKNIKSIFKKTGASFLIIAHLLTFGPAAEAFQSSLGEAAIGRAESKNYIAQSGFLYATPTSSPPKLIKYIPTFIWRKGQAQPPTIDLDEYFVSPDGLPLTYTVVGDNQIGAEIDPDTKMLTFSPEPEDWEGQEKPSVFKIKAEDAEGNETTSNPFLIPKEKDKNNPPVLDYIPDISVNETELVRILPTVTKLDDDEISYSFTAPLNEQGEWFTGYDDAGDYIVTVTATDSNAIGLSHSQDVKVSVKNKNRLPILEEIADIEANEGERVVIRPQASDPDDDALTFHYSLPFDSQGKWLTGYDDADTYNITVKALDGTDTVSKQVKVTVNNVNRAPEVKLTLDSYTVTPGRNMRIQLEASDPDGDPLTFSIKKDGEEIHSGTIDDGYHCEEEPFSDIGDYIVSVTVTDPEGLSAKDTKGVDVIDPDADAEYVKPIMGDFNGDSLTDLGLYNLNKGKIEVCLSDKGVFRNTREWSNSGREHPYPGRLLPLGGDFNGDGRSDIGLYNYDTGFFYTYISSGSDFVIAGKRFRFTALPADDWQVSTGNFNGDKYTDLVFYNRSTGVVILAKGLGNGFVLDENYRWLRDKVGGSYQWVCLPGDFNGDSLTDICIFKEKTGEVRVALANANMHGFDEADLWITGFGKDIPVGNYESPMVSDFNHDGLADIGIWDDKKHKIRYVLSTGNSFRDNGNWTESFGTSDDESCHLGDFNGDAISDMACFNKEEHGIKSWSLKIASSQPADLLEEIDNGVGGKTKVTYATASEYQNEELPFPLYVTKNISSIDSLPADKPQEVYTQEFSYKGGWYDTEEREFCGFEKVTVTDPASGNYTETYFHQAKSDEKGALKGKIEKVSAYDGNGMLISEIENTWKVRSSGEESKSLGFPYLEQALTTVWEEIGTPLTTKDGFHYDIVGNIDETLSLGDIATEGDEKRSRIFYNEPYEAGFNRPKETLLKDIDGNILTRKLFTEYDARGNLKEEKVWLYNPLTQSEELIPTTYDYDDFGNAISITNAEGNSVTTKYEDTFHTFAEEVTNALGHTVEYNYDPAFGLVTDLTDANGYTTTTKYDSLGRVVHTKNTSGEIVTSYSYPDFNTKITQQLNLLTTEHIDGLGRTYKTVSSGEDGANSRNVITQVFYNERGLKEAESLPHYEGEDEDNISYVRYEYDMRGRVKKTTSDFPGSAKDAYALTSYISPLYTEAQDPKGHKKGILKDVFGNNIRITEFTGGGPASPAGGVYHTNYKYDLQGNLSKVTDAKGNITQVWYDSLGRKLKMDDPDMGVWTYEYDKLGNLIKQTDAKEQTLQFEYDDLNRLTKKYAGSKTLSIYRYRDDLRNLSSYTIVTLQAENKIGRLDEVLYLTGRTEFFYDSEGREIKSIKYVDTNAYKVERTYDILDRLKTLTYPDGEVINYTYDTNSGLLEKVQGEETYVPDISYNASGQIKTIQYGNETETSYNYGNDLRLERILTKNPTTSLQDLTYDFDKNGNLTTLTDNLTSNIRGYGYDDLDRLISAENIPHSASSQGYTTLCYHYDPIGNMTYKSDAGVMTYGQNGAGPHAVTSLQRYQITSYTYDANGNMTNGKDKVMQYDIENRLSKVVKSSGATTEFYYDGDGGRVKKTVDTTKVTVYIGSLYEVEQGNIITKHIFAGSNRICSLKSNNTSSYYHSDHLGSSNVITDGSGNRIANYEYQPYGKTSKQTGTDITNHKFTGKELDDSTGLYYYGARYYDPEIGRFITADTIVQHPNDPQDLNRYAYCRNNPIKYVDPTGHGWFSKIIGAIAAVFAFIVTGGPAGNPASVTTAMAVFSSLDASISSYQAGASIGRAIGIGAACGTAASLGGYLGGMFSNAIGGGAFGQLFYGAMGAGAFGAAAGAALTGGNVGKAAAAGAAAGAIGGMFGAGGNFLLGLVGAGVAGGTASSILGESFGSGAATGAISFVAFSIISGSLQAALDAGYRKGGVEGKVKAAEKIATSATSTGSKHHNPSDALTVQIEPEKIVLAEAKKEGMSGVWKALIRQLKEKLTTPDPPKNKSLREIERFIIEWIDRLGPWVPLTIQKS